MSTPSLPRILLAAACICILEVLAYWGIQHNTFHFDDWPNILDNPSLHMSQLSLGAIAEAAEGSFLRYRPFASVSFAIDWWRGGGSAPPFLVTNLALHIVTAWAVFALILQTTPRNDHSRPQFSLVVCALAALWWAAQPIHVQAVSYVVQRMTELAALFTILAVWAWCKARSAPKHPVAWFLISASALSLGALSKENAWIAPLLILMAELLVVRHQQPMLRTPFDRALLALPLLGAIVALIDLASDGPISRLALAGYHIRDFTLAERVLTQPKVVLFHISQILWPAPGRFSLEHDVEIVSAATNWHFWLPMLVILAWTSAGLMLASRPGYRLHGFFVLWVPATLIIESSVVPLELIFEHRMYLPAVGFAGLIALGIGHARQYRPALAPALIALVAAHTLFSLWATQMRIPQWRTEATLYEQAVRVAPNSARAWNHLGIALLDQKSGQDIPLEQREQAIAAFDRAIRIDASHAAAWTNRGVARYFGGDHDGALADLRRAISLNPRQAAVQHYLGRIYAERGLTEDARIARKRACALGVSIDCDR